MLDKIMNVLFYILMAVEFAAVLFLIVQWNKAKKEQEDREDG